MNLEDRIKRRDDLIGARMDDNTVMMDVTTGKYYQLTGPGSDIWELIDDYITVKEVIDELMKRYDVSYEACAKNTIEFLSDLQNKGTLIIESND